MRIKHPVAPKNTAKLGKMQYYCSILSITVHYTSCNTNNQPTQPNDNLMNERIDSHREMRRKEMTC
jgi:hypothetical protein